MLAWRHWARRLGTEPNDFDLLRVVAKGQFGKVMEVRPKRGLQLYALEVRRRKVAAPLLCLLSRHCYFVVRTPMFAMLLMLCVLRHVVLCEA